MSPAVFRMPGIKKSCGARGRNKSSSELMEDYMRSAKIAAVLMFVLVSSSALVSQTGTGQVSGTVTDPSAALVAGASVRLINVATNIETPAETNNSGYFVFINVRPGSYVLSVQKQGFKSARTAPFDLDVSREVSRPVTLALGRATETVEVTS